jgi:PAS domain S-box-containing protein
MTTSVRAPRFDWSHLRRRAEERLQQRKEAVTAHSPDVDLQRLIHELEVHQVELEMQNEELRETRLDLEAGLQRYTEIFDFAPVAYVNIGLDGAIREINHAGARLLGEVRSRLVSQNFASLLTGQHAAAFRELVYRVIQSDTKETCEIVLSPRKGPAQPVRLLARLLARVEPTILLALECSSDGRQPQPVT